MLQRTEHDLRDGGIPLDPTFVSLSMTHNRYGQPVTVQDDVLKDASSPPVRNFDQENSYDRLRRLFGRDEGELASGSIGTQSRKQVLARDLAGRTITDQVSLNADGIFTDGPPNAIDAGEMDDDRVFNKRNELRSRQVLDYDNPSTPRTVTLVYDKNGNLRDDGEKYKYIYNPFGQLVRIAAQSEYPLAVYTYNGLGQRISEQLDCNDSSGTGTPDGIVDGYDPVFYLALDQQGRRVATYRGSDTYAKEAFIWHPAGLGGPALRTGGLLLRDRNDSLVDPTQWALEEGQETRAERMYACSDFRGDVVALVRLGEHGGELAEQYRYSATGIPMGIPLGDLNADGLVDYGGAEEIVLKDAFSPNYQVRADLNLDGVVDSTDEGIVVANDGVQTGRGVFSAPAVGSRVGFKQMEAFGEGFGVVWTNVRFCHHSGLGRSIAGATSNFSLSYQSMYSTFRTNPCGERGVASFVASNRGSISRSNHIVLGDQGIRLWEPSPPWQSCVASSTSWVDCAFCCPAQEDGLESNCAQACKSKHPDIMNPGPPKDLPTYPTTPTLPAPGPGIEWPGSPINPQVPAPDQDTPFEPLITCMTYQIVPIADTGCVLELMSCTVSGLPGADPDTYLGFRISCPLPFRR